MLGSMVALLLAAELLACWLEFPPAKAACGSVFVAALAGASAIDLESLVIPDLLTVGLALAGLGLSALCPPLHGIASGPPLACLRSLAAGVLGLAIGSALGLWIAVLGEWLLAKEILGFGDVKLLGAIGAFCGWRGAVFAVVGGAAIAALALAAAEGHRRLSGRGAVRLLRLESPAGETGRLGWGARFPFGPMLAAAAALYFLGPHAWADAWLAPYALLF